MKKKKFKWCIFTVMLALFNFFLVMQAFAEPTIDILIPSAGQSSVIQPGKDFYVLGNLYGLDKQAVYAYLWHRIGRCAADDWEKYCLNEAKVLFTDDKIDQLRKEYICRADSELNICRILLNLDLAKHGSLPTQLQHINSNEREIIKSDLPLLAKLAGFLR